MKKPYTSLPLNDDDESAVLDLSDEISPDGKLIVVGYEIYLVLFILVTYANEEELVTCGPAAGRCLCSLCTYLSHS